MRAKTLAALLRAADISSIHTPLTRGAVIVNTARSPVPDIGALVEPPREPLPRLLDPYRERETWVEGRWVVTSHAAFCSPEACRDVQRRGQEILYSVLFTDRPQNIIDLSVE